ncbi:MAG: hypothetical protein R3E85_17540 [Planctomycetota bacterium]
MRTPLVLALLLALALAPVLGIAQANDAPGKSADLGAALTLMDTGEHGLLEVSGMPGDPFLAFDAFGNPLACGAVDAGGTAIMVPTLAVGLDGVRVTVVVGPEIYQLTGEPDWFLD